MFPNHQASRSNRRSEFFTTRLGPRSAGRVVLFGILGLALIFCSRFLFAIFPGHFPKILIPLWLCWAAAAAFQFFGWPCLFKTLLAYGLAARIPVAIVMFFAMLRKLGTHYDYVGMPPPFSMPPVPRYLWLALFPATCRLGSVHGGRGDPRWRGGAGHCSSPADRGAGVNDRHTGARTVLLSCGTDKWRRTG